MVRISKKKDPCYLENIEHQSGTKYKQASEFKVTMP